MSLIDTTFDVTSDAGGRDPDSHSKTLRRYHRLLWSKPLPDGTRFTLDEKLHHQSARGEFWLASDAITNSYKDRPGTRAFAKVLAEVPPEEIDELFAAGCTVGAYIVFPYGKRIDRRTSWSINQSRGMRALIADRFDLTLECIRRYYHREWSPLDATLANHRDFFDLFETFDGYVTFFLLDDLVENGQVRFFTEFNEFTASARPRTVDEYRQYKAASIDFVRARNARIDAYPIDRGWE